MYASLDQSRNNPSPAPLMHTDHDFPASPISSLAGEILLEIGRVEVLEILDVLSCSLVCRRWNEVFGTLTKQFPNFSHLKLVGDYEEFTEDWIEEDWNAAHEYARRLMGLLAESKRMGLNHRNKVQSIQLNLRDMFDWLSTSVHLPEMEDFFVSVFSIGFPNLKSIHLEYTLIPSGELPLDRIRLFLARILPFCNTVDELMVIDRDEDLEDASDLQNPRHFIKEFVQGLSRNLTVLILSCHKLDSGLEEALKNCRNLSDITFEEMNSDDVTRCIQHWPNLRSLGMRLSEQPSDELLLKIGANLPNLCELHIHGSKLHPGPKVLVELLGRCNRLRELILTDMDSVDDTVLGVIAGTCRNLKNLWLSNSERLTGLNLPSVSIHWQKMERLYLDGCSNVEASFVGNVVANSLNISELKLPRHLEQNGELRQMLVRSSFRCTKKQFGSEYWEKVVGGENGQGI
ncbi:hypothetical protein BC938DRAFT_482124 [Jimgerdemannia flammicorona]|uniref:F-box domain-containing protein n=1 Tax=Jimgerdemannia flammicorona TaxID=994334 RepID=A0A433QEQ8_9FUNG|nr:hypothetical protein BC938DRAFT_482124 [Jimgerdemannia flammicorona]